MKQMLESLRHKTTTSIQLNEFDSIRGWAIVFVVLHHYYVFSGKPELVLTLIDYKLPLTFFIGSSGDAGLNLFFFLSGFLLFLRFGQAYYNGWEMPFLWLFYKRRLQRIVPAYYVCLAIVVVICYRDYLVTREGLLQILSHLTFMHTLFAEHQRAILNVFWTLGVEMEFYIVLPFIASWFFGKRSLAALPLFILFALIFRYFCFVLFSDCVDCRVAVADILPGRLDQFAIGMTCANLWLFSKNTTDRRYDILKNKFMGSILVFVGIIISVISIYFVNYSINNYGSGNLFYVVFWHVPYTVGIGITAYGLLNAGNVKKILVNPVMGFMGIISYSLYLWHNYLLKIFLQIPFVAGATGFEKFVLVLIIVGPIALIVATISYVFVERPFLKKNVT